jgi:hypothetical protein
VVVVPTLPTTATTTNRLSCSAGPLDTGITVSKFQTGCGIEKSAQCDGYRASGPPTEGTDITAGTDTPMVPDEDVDDIADLRISIRHAGIFVLSFCRHQRPQLHVGVVPLKALQPPPSGEEHQHDSVGTGQDFR